MISRPALAAMLAALCLVFLPVSASASPRGFEARFELEADHGYRLAVSGSGDTVIVEVGRPRSLHPGALPRDRLTSQSLTAYVARGTVTPRRIAASFGKFGRIDVRFRPTGKAVALPVGDHCRGPDHFTSRRGVFAGGIEFEGEHRYVAVRAHRAPGRVRSPLRLHCLSGRFRTSATRRERPVGPDGGSPHETLAAVWRHAVSSTELYSFADRRRAFTVAVVEESLGRMAEFHQGLTLSRPQVFAIDNALTKATLAPPPPFHGTGTYEAAPDGSKSWTGSLSVSFPGAPRRPLTGEQFKVSVSAGL